MTKWIWKPVLFQCATQALLHESLKFPMFLWKWQCNEIRPKLSNSGVLETAVFFHVFPFSFFALRLDPCWSSLGQLCWSFFLWSSLRRPSNPADTRMWTCFCWKLTGNGNQKNDRVKTVKSSLGRIWIRWRSCLVEMQKSRLLTFQIPWPLERPGMVTRWHGDTMVTRWWHDGDTMVIHWESKRDTAVTRFFDLGPRHRFHDKSETNITVCCELGHINIINCSQTGLGGQDIKGCFQFLRYERTHK